MNEQQRHEEKQQQGFPFLALPAELQLSALAWLAAPLVANNDNPGGSHDLFHCHLVCKHFSQLLQNEYFWQRALHQASGVVGAAASCCSLPDDVHSWKELYQLQFNHLEAAPGSEELLSIDNRKQSVTLKKERERTASEAILGSHFFHVRAYASRSWHSDKQQQHKGKHYWEVRFDWLKSQTFVGVLPASACNTYSGIVGYTSNPGWSITPYTGKIQGNRGQDSTPSPPGFRCLDAGEVLGICLDIDNGRLDYWRNGEYLTGLQAESIKHNGPYRAAISLLKKGEKATFHFNAKMPASIPQ
ncbi:hypothetical protein QOT17_000912 [Balamuthia mandrillaris]